jgi:hypothetical protein
VTAIPPHLGSNGHEVSIHLSRHAHVAVAEVRTAQDKRFVLPQTSILNGLTSQPIRLEEIQSIARNNSSAFVAVYLPETAKVYIWPRIQAAGLDKYTYIVTGNANIFAGKSQKDVQACLESSRLIPGTNKAFNSVGGWKVEDSNSGGAKNWTAGNGDITINHDGGNWYKGKKEPEHVDIIIRAKESRTNSNGITKEYTKPYAYKFPIKPNEPDWARMIRDGDFKSTSKLPIHDPAPPRNPNGGGNGGNSGSRGGGNKEGGGNSGGGRGNGGNAGSGGNRGGHGGNAGSGGHAGGGGGKSGAGGGFTGSFQNNLNQNNLVDSYNSANPNQPLLKTGHQQDIGGVAVANPNAVLLNLNSSLYDLTAEGYWITFPFLTKEAPFSNQWLQQIIRELAQNIYLHNTFPFYSLHFTKAGTLYSVIHPGYQNTLVGKVIGMIDYFMKGYLNGGYFNEPDLMRLAGDKSAWIQDLDQLKPSIQSMETLYQKTFQDDSEYQPLTQLLQRYHIEQYQRKLDKATLDKIQQRFQISFRIIAKQDQIEKHDSTLLFHGGMDVLYTIECHRAAIAQLEEYKVSEEYQLLQNFCDQVANDIKIRLPKLEPCQHYFKMLDVICALSYYFSSLKRQEMMPKLWPVKADAQQTCPGHFLSYPSPKTRLLFN